MLVGVVTFSSKSFIRANPFSLEITSDKAVKQSRTPRVRASNFDLNNKERSWEFLVVHPCIDDFSPAAPFLSDPLISLLVILLPFFYQWSALPRKKDNLNSLTVDSDFIPRKFFAAKTLHALNNLNLRLEKWTRQNCPSLYITRHFFPISSLPRFWWFPKIWHNFFISETFKVNLTS